MKKLQPTQHPGIYKDPRSGMVINTNMHEYYAIVEKRRQAAEADRMKEEVSELKSTLAWALAELTRLKGESK
jgi:hypothetical protein